MTKSIRFEPAMQFRRGDTLHVFLGPILPEAPYYRSDPFTEDRVILRGVLYAETEGETGLAMLVDQFEQLCDIIKMSYRPPRSMPTE